MTDLYDDLPNDLKGMVDEYTGPRAPGTLGIAKEVCCECMCGGLEYNYAKRTCRACINNKECIGSWIGGTLLVIAGLAVVIAIGYLLFWPLSNVFIGLTFTDLKCDWYGRCNPHGINSDGGVLQVSYNSDGWRDDINSNYTAMGGIGMVLMSLMFVGCVVGLSIWMCVDSYLIRSEKACIWFFISVVAYIAFVTAISLVFYFSLAKTFGALHDPDKCKQFVGLPFVYWYYNMHHPPTPDSPWGYDGFCGYSDCCPFKRIGFLQGVQYDLSLPWDVNGCTICKEYGWKYLPIFVITPVVVGIVCFVLFLCIRRCSRKVKKVNQRYYDQV